MNQHPFKVGDIVRCIDDTSRQHVLRNRRRYLVTHRKTYDYTQFEDAHYVGVRDLNQPSRCDDREANRDVGRFVLVQRPEPAFA